MTVQMAERRRLNRMAERDVADWLYARYLNLRPEPKHALLQRSSM
ncbi:hypothetical protein ACNKHO_08230 [Shigella flexneri]